MGRFTLPGEAGMEKEIKELMEKWGVDAIRDSDGTSLSEELLELGLEVYSTLCLIRMDNEWIKKHPECRQQIYLLSERYTATEQGLKINIMSHLYGEQFEPNTDVDMNKYWQVMDRTSGERVVDWTYDEEEKSITVKNAAPFHEYDVAFLAYQNWEPVSMYNHITNNWTKEHKIPIDVRHPEAGDHILKVLQEWLETHPKTDVVRFTTFIYCFDLIYNERGKEKQVNWFGYAACVSPLAMEQFAKEYGYELTPEDFVDNGMYNTPFKNPTKKYLDWMDFNQRFVSEYAGKCVSLVHKYGKKAIMFLGDHWAGTEPYGKYFKSIGLDAVVGAAGDGVTTRMIADIPVKETEARFYPYFFPDVFHKGGDPVKESQEIWVKCRRAILQKPMERMGYGGYLSLAYKFPDFVTHVSDVARQFNEIYEKTNGRGCDKTGIRIAVLNTWGRIRTWQTHQVAHSLWNQRCYSYLGALEALAGLPVEISFVSFDDIKNGDIDSDTDIILNVGDAGTSWSGGDNWSDEAVVAKIRRFVYQGGGFIGIGEPTAYLREGRLFALADVMGVQKEMGFTASINKPEHSEQGRKHFITEGIAGKIDYGEGTGMIYRASETATVLDTENRSCSLVVNEYGEGRSLYMAGCPYDHRNSGILYRALFWLSKREEDAGRWLTGNTTIERNTIDDGRIAVYTNQSGEDQSICLKSGRILALDPYEMKIIEE